MSDASVRAANVRIPLVARGGFSSPGGKYSTEMASILIVDDESLIRWSVAQTLEAEGFTVVEAASAREALDRLDKDGDIALVLLDLKLPDSSDLSLLRTLRQRAPGCQIILMTAHGTTEILDEAIDAGAFRALGKPFDLGYMVKVVRDAMAA